MIVYRKVVLKVVLNRIVNLPDSGYLPDTRYPAGYPVDPDIRYSPTNGTSLSMNDVPLTITKFTADLGVLVDPYLKFEIHIRDIAVRAKQRAAIIHRCFVSRNTHNLVLAFKIYVRPLLEYASQIWNPFLKYQIDLIESKFDFFSANGLPLQLLYYHTTVIIILYFISEIFN